MEERDVDETPDSDVPNDDITECFEDAARQDRTHATTPIPPVRSGRTRTVSAAESLARTEQRIQAMYRDGRITVVTEPSVVFRGVAASREVFKPRAEEERRSLREQVAIRQGKIGSTRIPSGVLHEIHYGKKVFSIVPYWAWVMDYLVASNSERSMYRGEQGKRDFLIWLLWHFRDTAILQFGDAPNRVRGQVVDCVQCGSRHPAHRRVEDERGRRHCRRCGALAFRPVEPKIEFRPLTITKTGLQRRFRISRRALQRILSAPVPKYTGNPVPLI
jgi:hypothetical protein